MRQNVQDIARAATGIASDYQLTNNPASASIKVAKGLPGQGAVIPRSRTNGWDYDPVRNRIVFYGDARPRKGEEIVVGYRRWDWKGNMNRPPDLCDLCEDSQFCDPELDIAQCEDICGGEVCDNGLVCLPDYAECGEPGQNPDPGGNNMNPADECGGCSQGLVCNPATADCVTPCEQTGCAAGLICSTVTHLCRVPNF
jgi:hypothetical protein